MRPESRIQGQISDALLWAGNTIILTSRKDIKYLSPKLNPWKILLNHIELHKVIMKLVSVTIF
jgi:hypothetical protein